MVSNVPGFEQGVHGFESTGTWFREYSVHSFEGTEVQDTRYIFFHYPKSQPRFKPRS